MSTLAPTLERFFTERLIGQKGASVHTVAAYADTFRLLLAFGQDRTNKAPSALDFSDLDAPLVGAFLDHCVIRRKTDTGSDAKRTKFRSYPDKVPAESGHLI